MQTNHRPIIQCNAFQKLGLSCAPWHSSKSSRHLSESMVLVQELWPVNNDASTACVTMETRKADVLSKVPMNRMGEPCDVVKAVEFLSCVSSAGYISGQVIRVDGGRSLSQ